jgi:tetratricopeptide (TPR) repeat protein
MPSASNQRTLDAWRLLGAAVLLALATPLHADVIQHCRQCEDPALAIRACSRLILADPGNADHYNSRGIAHMHSRQLDRAIADYSEAIRLDPEPSWPYYNRGRALLGKGAYVEAIPDFSEALSRNPRDALAHNGRGWALFKLGNLVAALEDADYAIAVDSAYAAAYDTRAHIYEAMRQGDKAIADFRRALALAPDDPLAHITRQGLARLGVEP